MLTQNKAKMPKSIIRITMSAYMSAVMMASASIMGAIAGAMIW